MLTRCKRLNTRLFVSNMNFLIILMGDLIPMYIASHPTTLADDCVPLRVNINSDLQRGTPSRVLPFDQPVPSFMVEGHAGSSRLANGRGTIRLNACSL